MSDGQATTTANPITTYGSSDVKNQVRPGGNLGSRRYYPIVNASTGKIDVYRYEDGNSIQVGSIPRGGNFRSTTQSTSSEITHFSSAAGTQKFRDNAKQVVTREWRDAGASSQPPPDTVINGENSINAAYGAKNNKGEVFEGTRPEEGGASIASEDTWFEKKRQNQARKKRAPKPTLVYPLAIRQSGNNVQDYLQIDMMEYMPKKMQFNEGNMSGFGERPKNRKSLGTVVLPIPSGIQDSNAVSWGGDKMDPMAAATANIALAAVQKGLGEAGVKIGDAATGLLANKDETKTALGTAIAGLAAGTGGAQLLTRTTGQVLNPNMELLFKEPTLRPFNFSWTLSPRSQREAMEVVKIIRFFKQGIAPGKSESNLFLKSPNTFRFSYKHRGQDHKYLNKFKECAINSFTTQYTPNGNYSTFEDGVMTAYQITMGLQELEPIYSTDYEDSDPSELSF